MVNGGLDEVEVDLDENFSQGSGNLLNIVMCRFREIHSKIESYRILLRPMFGEAERPVYSKHSWTWRHPRIALDKTKHLPKLEHSQTYSFAYKEKVANYYLDIES